MDEILGKLIRNLILLALAGYLFFHIMEAFGLRNHEADSSITAQVNWIEGESKDCFTIPLDRPAAALEGKKLGYAFSDVHCDDGPEHSVKINFIGRELQPQKKLVFWRCTKKQADFWNETPFTCKQTGAE